MAEPKPKKLIRFYWFFYRESAMEWSAETLRLSVFCDRPRAIGDADWRAVTGQEEAEERKTVPARRILSGDFQDGRLQFVSAGSRLDCILTPKLLEPPDAEILVIGEFETACARFVDATMPWLKNLSANILRIAFGSVVLLRCPDRQQAYEELLSLLRSVKGDTGRMRDLIFRINWPVESKVAKDITLNRLTSWSVVNAFVRHIDLGDPGKPRVQDLPAAHFVRLEIDHNTPGDRQVAIDQPLLLPIYAELVELALENAAKGELT